MKHGSGSMGESVACCTSLCTVVDQWSWVDGGTAMEGLVRQSAGGRVCDGVRDQRVQVCHRQRIGSHGEL